MSLMYSSLQKLLSRESKLNQNNKATAQRIKMGNFHLESSQLLTYSITRHFPI